MPWFRDKLVSDRKSGCYGEVGYHGTLYMDHNNLHNQVYRNKLLVIKLLQNWVLKNLLTATSPTLTYFEK